MGSPTNLKTSSVTVAVVASMLMKFKSFTFNYYFLSFKLIFFRFIHSHGRKWTKKSCESERERRDRGVIQWYLSKVRGDPQGRTGWICSTVVTVCM
jgi:hypothetical protein